MAEKQKLIKLFVRRYGVHRGGVYCAQFLQLALTARRLGRVPTAVEYADDWAISERSAWYHREHARGVFGERWEEAVLEVAGLLEEAMSRKQAREVVVPGRLVAAVPV